MNATATTAAFEEASAPPRSGLVAAYGLALLFLANVLNFADRALLGIVIEPIRKDLNLSDTQISVMGGLAFSIVYLVVGIVISRRVDRGNRRLILAFGIVVWSIATAATGLAQGFLSLAGTRMLIGIGEATVFPVAMSLLADLYVGPRLPRAVSVFQSSQGVGIMVGSIFAGILAAALGWRTMFGIFGAAGLALALLITLTMRPTPRTVTITKEALAKDGLSKALREIIAVPGLPWLAIGYATSHMLMQCLPAWAPAFLQRSHGVALHDVGLLVGPPAVVGGLTGTILSGMLATRLIQRTGNRRAGLLVPIIAMPLAVPAYAMFLFAPSLPLVMVGIAIMNFMLSTGLGPCVALAVSLVPPSRRALTSTMMLITQTLLGVACGPILVGVISDALKPAYGADSLRYALSVMLVAPFATSLLLLIARSRIRAA